MPWRTKFIPAGFKGLGNEPEARPGRRLDSPAAHTHDKARTHPSGLIATSAHGGFMQNVDYANFDFGERLNGFINEVMNFGGTPRTEAELTEGQK